MNFDALLQETETALRAGQRELARANLLKIKGKALPRSKARQFATLARRAGMLDVALQIMRPIVRPKTNLDVAASAEEIATYGLILLGFGAIQECRAILNLSDQNNPDILMAQAFSSIKIWDYAKAIVFLEKYISSDSLKGSSSDSPSDYLKTVAMVNLAASQIAIGNPANLERGRHLVKELLEKTAKEGWALLESNARELALQVAIQDRDWASCDSFFMKADEVANGQPADSQLFTQKWRAISEVLREKESVEGLAKLRKVRHHALEQGHWETVRDCDFHEAIATRNSNLALHVYFGTPFPTYRKRLRDATADWLVIPDSYLHHPLPQATAETRIFQMNSGEERNNKNVTLPVGKSLHTALQILVSDFYRPFLIGSLFSEVFRDEYFNPVSSPRRVAFLVHRLRNWFDENNVPLDIVSNRDGYRLLATAPYTLELSSQGSSGATSNQSQYERLQGFLKRNNVAEFTAREIAVALDTSERSARYFLKWAVESNLVTRTGSGRQIRYKL
ncbi:MAG: hypothetical protein U1E10_02965 [Bdellovibrionales bacterium]|nr:hypothetical protein [Bdellovibrionales bacterium]